MRYPFFLKNTSVWVAAFLALPALLFSQNPLPENAAIELVLKNHPAIAAAEKTVASRQILARSAAAWEPAQIYQNVAADPDLGLFGTTVFGVQQNFPSRKSTEARRLFFEKNAQIAQTERLLTEKEAVQKVRETYLRLAYLEARLRHLEQLDSLFSRAEKIAATRHAAGETDRAEALVARDRAAQIRLERGAVGDEMAFETEILGLLLGQKTPPEPLIEPLKKADFSLPDADFLEKSAAARLLFQQAELAKTEAAIQKTRRAPTVSGAVFGQVLGDGQIFPGWQIGLNVPLARRSLARQIESADLAAESAESARRAQLLERSVEAARWVREQKRLEILLAQHEKEGRALAAELLRNAELNYRNGETDFLDFAKMAERAAQIDLDFIENLFGFDRATLVLRALAEQ